MLLLLLPLLLSILTFCLVKRQTRSEQAVFGFQLARITPSAREIRLWDKAHAGGMKRHK